MILVEPPRLKIQNYDQTKAHQPERKTQKCNICRLYIFCFFSGPCHLVWSGIIKGLSNQSQI